MRTLTVVAALFWAVSCSGRTATCADLSCGSGKTCGFKSQSPECFTPCPAAGTCAGGAACSCAGSCAGCENCIQVCP